MFPLIMSPIKAYSYLPRWMKVVQHFLPGTIVKYKTSGTIMDNQDDSTLIRNLCFGLLSHALKDYHIASRSCKLMAHF